MKKKSKNIGFFTNPRQLSDDGLEEYLKSIKFDERLEQGRYFSGEEFKKILLTNLRKYFQGKVTQDFIIGLGSAIYPEVFINVGVSVDKGDDALLTTVCMIEDLAYGTPERSTGERDKVLRSALKILEKDIAKTE